MFLKLQPQTCLNSLTMRRHTFARFALDRTEPAQQLRKAKERARIGDRALFKQAGNTLTREMRKAQARKAAEQVLPQRRCSFFIQDKGSVFGGWSNLDVFYLLVSSRCDQPVKSDRLSDLTG